MTGLFLSPAWLPLVALGPIAWIALRTLEGVRARRLTEIAGPRVAALSAGADPGRRVARRALLAAGLLLAAVAVLEPAWGQSSAALEQRGADVVVCLDVSRSMLARDESPDRLERARREIRALIARTRGDRLGLVAFAGEARLVVPLTRDMESFDALLATTDPLTVRRGGTDLGAALDTALAAFDDPTGEGEAIVVLTDGEDFSGRGLAAARRCVARGVPVHCVGLGSALGSKIAVPAPRGEEFVRDAAGRDVVTALDEASLRRVAAAANGEFVSASKSDAPLADVYESRIVPSIGRSLRETERRRRTNRFQWPLLAAFGLLALELSLGSRRGR